MTHKPMLSQGYTDLFYTPLPAHLCLSCGLDPRIEWDALGHYQTGWNEAVTLDERRLCPECAAIRRQWEARP